MMPKDERITLLVNFGWDVFHEHCDTCATKRCLPEVSFIHAGAIFFMAYIAKKLPLNKNTFFEIDDLIPLSTTQDKLSISCIHYLNESLFKKKIVAGIIRPHPFLRSDFFETIEILEESMFI